jgi:hypothetical protein
MANALEQFYIANGVYQPLIVGEGGDLNTEQLWVASECIYRSDSSVDIRKTLGSKMVQLYQSIEPITVKVRVDGRLRSYTYETAWLQQGEGDETEAIASSYSSSGTGNPGNITEVAEKALLNPDRSYAYVASPGNGLTSRLSLKESWYFQKYGRLLYEDEGVCKPLPFVEGLYLALKERGISPSRFRSDSAGASLTTALGTVPQLRGEIRSIHQNVRANINEWSPLRMAYGMLYTESRINGPQHTKDTPDILSVPKWDGFVREHIPDSYLAKNYKPAKSPIMVGANLFGLARGPKTGDPLLADNIAFLRNNGDADVLFTNGREDPLIDPDAIDTRMGEICRELSRFTTGRVMAAVTDGTSHGLHTFYPQFVDAVSRATLG